MLLDQTMSIFFVIFFSR